jgi:hypothetical protein
LGNFLGDFLLSLGDFLTKTSGHPGWQSGILGKKKQLATPEINSWIFFSLVLGTEEETRFQISSS